MVPEIPQGSKVIVGIGDSFTQGVGSWSDETYERYNGKIDPLKIPISIINEMYENSWVSQLCKNHLTDYIPVNFGIMGTGNRAAAKELYLNPKVQLDNASEVIVIMVLSGMERFDFVNKEFPEHNHFYTMWPNPWDKKSTNKSLWKAYAGNLWSEKFAVIEAMLNILDAYNFCKARGYRFIVSSAFEQKYTRDYFLKVLPEVNKDLALSVPWENFLYPQGMKSFMELLLTLDGNPEMVNGDFYVHYSKLEKPTKYITNCMHPTKEGYRIMAEEIFNFIKNRE
jgi:lysophospholipase L1-like esterase